MTNRNRGCDYLMGLNVCSKRAVAYYPAANNQTMDLCAEHAKRFAHNPEVYGLRDIKTDCYYVARTVEETKP